MHLDIAFEVHQCARFCAEPRLSHEKTVHCVIKYLNLTKEQGLVFKPNADEGITCYADADFAFGWNLIDSNNRVNVLSCTGFVIFFCGCLLT